MTWIRTLSEQEAEGSLAKIYETVKGPDGRVDNILKAHSLRPHTLKGHMGLYKNVLHHSANELPKWFLECIGVWVSQLNQCHYCVDHHAEGMRRLLADENRFDALMAALKSGHFLDVLPPGYDKVMDYAKKLTLTPSMCCLADVEALRGLGISDGEILEVNQVVAYFCYANRTVLGLGVSTSGDVLGLSPSGESWQHQ